MKQYQNLYNAINQAAQVQARDVFCLPENKVAHFVDCFTRNRYSTACRLIKAGVKTEEELIATYSGERG